MIEGLTSERRLHFSRDAVLRNLDISQYPIYGVWGQQIAEFGTARRATGDGSLFRLLLSLALLPPLSVVKEGKRAMGTATAQ